MEKILEEIKVIFYDFSVEAHAQVARGNKAAGARSRKHSLELGGLLKKWRKASVEGKN